MHREITKSAVLWLIDEANKKDVSSIPRSSSLKIVSNPDIRQFGTFSEWNWQVETEFYNFSRPNTWKVE